jgi:hypothetical protein
MASSDVAKPRLRHLTPCSFHFTVCGMLSARIAELFGFHSIGMLLLVLCCCVVPILAIIALQRDDFAHSAGPF